MPAGHRLYLLYPAEFCACKSINVLMNIHLGVESRNSARATAQKHAALHLQPHIEGGDADPAEPRRALEFEDVLDKPLTKTRA